MRTLSSKKEEAKSLKNLRFVLLRIPEFRKLRMKIKRHFNAIVASAEMGITNACMEAINNKMKRVIRAAYGFRNMNNVLNMILLTCSSVRPRLPSR